MSQVILVFSSRNKEMEGDTQVNGDISSDKTTCPQEHIDDVEDTSDVAGAIETRTFISLDGQFRSEPGEPLVNKTESTTAEDGLTESISIKLKTASGCGHVLHTGSEAGLRCVSCSRLGKEPLILCSECAKNADNICFVCNSVCCYRCRRERRIESEDRLVCLACVRSTLRLKLIRQIIKWLLVAAAVYFLIMF
jgi:hypothetical protein